MIYSNEDFERLCAYTKIALRDYCSCVRSLNISGLCIRCDRMCSCTCYVPMIVNGCCRNCNGIESLGTPNYLCNCCSTKDNGVCPYCCRWGMETLIAYLQRSNVNISACGRCNDIDKMVKLTCSRCKFNGEVHCIRCTSYHERKQYTPQCDCHIMYKAVLCARCNISAIECGCVIYDDDYDDDDEEVVDNEVVDDDDVDDDDEVIDDDEVVDKEDEDDDKEEVNIMNGCYCNEESESACGYCIENMCGICRAIDKCHCVSKGKPNDRYCKNGHEKNMVFM